jgi:hypothetical protein
VSRGAIERPSPCRREYKVGRIRDWCKISGEVGGSLSRCRLTIALYGVGWVLTNSARSGFFCTAAEFGFDQRAGYGVGNGCSAASRMRPRREGGAAASG